MNKQEYLSALRKRLNGLSEEDIEKSVEYYSEMIDDRVEEGLSEDEAVEALGSVEETASKILLDTPLTKLVKAKVKPKGSISLWLIVLLVLGAPLWLSLIVAALAVVLSIYIVIWVVALVLYTVVFALAVSAAACVAGAFVLLFKAGLKGFAVGIGGAFICAALAMLMFVGSYYAVKGIISLSKAILRGIKYCFIGKENTK